MEISLEKNTHTHIHICVCVCVYTGILEWVAISLNGTSVFLLENSMHRGAWWTIVHGVAELDMTEET